MMADAALENAIVKRDELEALANTLQEQLEKVRKEKTQAEQFITEWYEYAGEPTPPEYVDFKQGSTSTFLQHADLDMPIKKRRAKGNSKKEDVVEEARRIALERGEPIMRDDLYDVLVGRGYIIRGSNPQMVLSTMLWRMRNRIVRVKGGGYWPADIKNESVDYDPGAVNETPDQVRGSAGG